MKHILLIEDNLEIRENIAEILELANYKVSAAKNGRLGFELAIKEKPDLILCDILMPVLDGYGVLKLVNSHPELSGIPFIFLTAKTERADLRKGMESGADDYIFKPVDATELLQALEVRLHKSEVLKMKYEATRETVDEVLSSAQQLGMIDLTSDEREVRKFKKKQPLYSEGHHANFLYFIVRGKVKVFRTNDDGKELIIAIYKEGDFLGYNALLEESVYPDSAETMEEAEVMLIPKKDFMGIINSSSKLSKEFIKMLTKNMREREEQLLKFAYNSARKRVADSLLRVYDKFRKDRSEPLHLGIARRDLANVSGIARESVVRTLSDFKDEKLIDIVDEKIIVLQEDKLRNLLN